MYWQRVLAEVCNKAEPNQLFFFTNLAHTEQHQRHLARRRLRRAQAGNVRNNRAKPSRRYTSVFSQREMQVMAELLQGATFKEVGAALGLSPRTIETYVTNMRAKLKCRSKSELIRRVRTNELLGKCATIGPE